MEAIGVLFGLAIILGTFALFFGAIGGMLKAGNHFDKKTREIIEKWEKEK